MLYIRSDFCLVTISWEFKRNGSITTQEIWTQNMRTRKEHFWPDRTATFSLLNLAVDDSKNHDSDTNMPMHINAHICSWPAVAQRLSPLIRIKSGVILHGVCLTGWHFQSPAYELLAFWSRSDWGQMLDWGLNAPWGKKNVPKQIFFKKC